MSRHLYIQSARKLSFENKSIIIEKEGLTKPLVFPLEDLDLVFLEDSQTMITSCLLSELGNAGVSLVVCGRNFLPAAQSLPVNGHYLQSALLKLQLSELPYKKKKFWEYIVKQKISNQISVLQATTDDEEAIGRLKKYLEKVTPGDETNMEGVAAREYFSSLFGKDFIRFSDDPLSSALNYGYSIIASCVIRQVAFSGLEDNLGAWHDAQQNAYNLSYDLIEPFRQVVDYYLYTHESEIVYPITKNIKVGLIGLLNEMLTIEGKKYKLSYAVEVVVNSYIEYLKTGKTDSIKLPIYQPGLSILEEDDE